MSARQNKTVIEAPPLGKMFDLEPPRSIEAERSLLGCMLLDYRVIGDCAEHLDGPEAFYEPRHGQIYQALKHVHDEHNSGDIGQIRQHLTDQGVLDEVGGLDYLERLLSEVAVAGNASHFARIVADKHRLRRLAEACGEIVFGVYHAGQLGRAAQAIVDEAETAIFAVAQDGRAEQATELGAVVAAVHERLQAIADGRARAMGVETGYFDLDETLGGLQPGELIILAARPSMGKSAMATNIAEQLARAVDGSGAPTHRPPVPVGVFSLEMSKSSLAERMLASASGVSSVKLRRGILSEAELTHAAACADALARVPLFIDDTAGLSVSQLRSRARRMVQRHKVGVLVIDYLQLVAGGGNGRESRQEEVGQVSRAIKALARELNIPVLCLSQLNRSAENREGNRPRLSDLRESGSLEQDADVVLLLHREEYYHIGDTEWFERNPEKRGVAEIIVAKQRNGPTGSVPLVWDPVATRFRSAASPKAGASGAVLAAQGAPEWARDANADEEDES